MMSSDVGLTYQGGCLWTLNTMFTLCHQPVTPRPHHHPSNSMQHVQGSYSGQNGGVESRLHSVKELKASVAYCEYNGDSECSVNKGLYRVTAKE